MASGWNYFFYIRHYEISCNISTDLISENVLNKIYKFKIRLEQFTGQTKKAEKYWLVKTELSYTTINLTQYFWSFLYVYFKKKKKKKCIFYSPNLTVRRLLQNSFMIL